MPDNSGALSLTQAQLDDFKKLFPPSSVVHTVSLAQINAHARKRSLRGDTADVDPGSASAPIDRTGDCEIAVALWFWNTAFFALGMYGLANRVILERNGALALELAAILAPQEKAIIALSKKIIDPNISLFQKKDAIFALFQILKDVGLQAAIVSIFSHLTVLDFILYGATALATVAAAVATDGISEAVAIGIGWVGLVADTKTVFDQCYPQGTPVTKPPPINKPPAQLFNGRPGGIIPDHFTSPSSVAITENEDIYFSDVHNNAVLKFAKGTTTGVTVAGGSQGNGPGQLNGPRGICVDDRGNLWIADTQNNRIQYWPAGATSGQTLAGANAGWPLDSPVSVAQYLGTVYFTENPGLLKADAKGNFVPIARNPRLSRILPNGALDVIAGNGTPTPLRSPVGLAIDAHGVIHITDGMLIATNDATDASPQLIRITPNAPNQPSSYQRQTTNLAKRSDGENLPLAITLDIAGNVYILRGVNSIGRYPAFSVERWRRGGMTSQTVLTNQQLSKFSSSPFDFLSASGLAVDNAANLYFCSGNSVWRWTWA
jgi:sugar lactone lactonase YvrE